MPLVYEQESVDTFHGIHILVIRYAQCELLCLGQSVEWKHVYRFPPLQSCQENCTITSIGITRAFDTNAKRYLAAGTADGKLLLFNVGTGTCVGVLTDGEGQSPVIAVEFHAKLPFLIMSCPQGPGLLFQGT